MPHTTDRLWSKGEDETIDQLYGLIHTRIDSNDDGSVARFAALCARRALRAAGGAGSGAPSPGGWPR